MASYDYRTLFGLPLGPTERGNHPVDSGEARRTQPSESGQELTQVIGHRQQILNKPEPDDNSLGHRRRHAQRPVNPHGIIPCEVQCPGGLQIGHLAAEPVGKPGKPPHLHPAGEVLPLDMRGPDQMDFGSPADPLAVGGTASTRRSNLTQRRCG